MKGDTRGQLDQIMNELTKVYHRFKARIHEYHILVKMTIQFFRNLDQVCIVQKYDAINKTYSCNSGLIPPVYFIRWMKFTSVLYPPT